MLLRHAVHRPPHSLAIFTFEEVKKIDLYAQDSFFRHFDMYKFTLTVKDEMLLKTKDLLKTEKPKLSKITAGKKARYTDIQDLKGYFSKEELEAIKKEQEYMQSGPGMIERVLNE